MVLTIITLYRSVCKEHSKSNSSGAQYVALEKCFSHPSLVLYFFPYPMLLPSEHVSLSMSLWVGLDIFGIFWWQGQNIFRISLSHVGMMWKMFFHMYMDESHKMDENFGWKLNINELLWMIITSKRIIWMKILITWNVWMELILKQSYQMKTICTWKKITKRMKYLDEHGV